MNVATRLLSKCFLIFFILLIGPFSMAEGDDKRVASEKNTAVPSQKSSSNSEEENSVKEKFVSKSTKIKPDESKPEVADESSSFFGKAKNFILSPFSSGTESSDQLKKIALPKEFQNSGLRVVQKLNNGNLAYIDGLMKSDQLNNKILIAYIRSKKSICYLDIVSEDGNRSLASLEKCKYRNEIFVGDKVLPKKSLSKLKRLFKEKNHSIGFYYQLGNGEMAADNTDFGGDLQHYGFNAAMSFGEFFRVRGGYSLGEITPSNKLPTSSDFIGFSKANVYLLGVLPESLSFNLLNTEFRPLVGLYGLSEFQDGAPRFTQISVGGSIGLTIVSKPIKTSITTLFSYCFLQCYISEIENTSSFLYPEVSTFELDLEADIMILPWSDWGLIFNFNYRSSVASTAVTGGFTEISRDLSISNISYGLGLNYHF